MSDNVHGHMAGTLEHCTSAHKSCTASHLVCLRHSSGAISFSDRDLKPWCNRVFLLTHKSSRRVPSRGCTWLIARSTHNVLVRTTSVTGCVDRTHISTGPEPKADEMLQQDMRPIPADSSNRFTGKLSIPQTEVQRRPAVSHISNDSALDDVELITDDNMSHEDVPTGALCHRVSTQERRTSTFFVVKKN